MATLFERRQSFDDSQNHFHVFVPLPNTEWLKTIAEVYTGLRTECEVPLREINLDGLMFDTSNLKDRLSKRIIPRRQIDRKNFDTIRSDFGEVLCFMMLEEGYRTRFAYKSIRDRETIGLTARGIDVLGIEDGEILTVVIGEAKVSDEDKSPPKVVESAKDSLSKQHKKHLTDLDSTIAEIYDKGRRARDVELQSLFFTAALLLEQGRWDKIHVSACCLLVRPDKKFKETDFGTFRTDPDNYLPAKVRFIVFCVPKDIETIIDEWAELMSSQGVPNE